jgi:hypothetical protein
LLKLITAPLEIEIGPNDVRKLPPGLRLEAPVRRLVVIDREPPVTGTEVVGTVKLVTRELGSPMVPLVTFPVIE